MVDGPTFCFFKSLDNNMVTTLGIDVYLYSYERIQCIFGSKLKKTLVLSFGPKMAFVGPTRKPAHEL